MATRTVTTLPYTEFTTATGNYDVSRKPIDRVIIHTTDGTLEGAIQRFGTYGTQVSAHYIIDIDGKIYHGLEEFNTAYQCGNYAMNQRSIGIEHVDNGDYNGVRPDALYTESAKLVYDICTFYGIPIDREHILKHSEIIPTGCPDALDIDRIVREALSLQAPVLQGLAVAVGYNPTQPNQDVDVDGVHYHSTDGQTWEIVPPTISVVVEPPIPVVIPEPIVPEPITPPEVVVTPKPLNSPVVSQPSESQNLFSQFLALLIKLWQKITQN